MIDKDLKKMIRELEKQGFTLDLGKRHATLIAPNGARTNVPTGNNNRMGPTFLRKFAKANGGRI